MTWEVFLSQIAIGGITAVIAALITVHFAIKRYISEKLWEKRAEAYGAILEALHDMKRYPDGLLDSYEPGREISEGQKKELFAKYHEGKHELNRRVEVEQFFLADNLLTEIPPSARTLSALGTRMTDTQ